MYNHAERKWENYLAYGNDDWIAAGTWFAKTIEWDFAWIL